MHHSEAASHGEGERTERETETERDETAACAGDDGIIRDDARMPNLDCGSNRGSSAPDTPISRNSENWRRGASVKKWDVC